MSRGIRVGISERLLGECIQKNKELQQEVERLNQENEKLRTTLDLLIYHAMRNKVNDDTEEAIYKGVVLLEQLKKN